MHLSTENIALVSLPVIFTLKMSNKNMQSPPPQLLFYRLIFHLLLRTGIRWRGVNSGRCHFASMDDGEPFREHPTSEPPQPSPPYVVLVNAKKVLPPNGGTGFWPHTFAESGPNG